MVFLDTNILIYAFDEESPFFPWSRQVLAESIAGDGAAINTVVLTELCVGNATPTRLGERLQSYGLQILDLPAAVAPICSRAYGKYLMRRKRQTPPSARIPLPDFFIGAHAQVLKVPLITADKERYPTYFPGLKLITPS